MASSVLGSATPAALTMPFVMFNLGGEMVYVLHQRLSAQNVTVDKKAKVLQDMCRSLFDPALVKELFKPQPLYSHSSLREIFNKIAHSSIMRLGDKSMDKLYDLMTMGYKYQTLSCKTASELLIVTLNHIDTIIDLIGKSDASALVENARRDILTAFQRTPHSELIYVRQNILRLLQEKRIKVSLFLSEKIQNMDGTFNIQSSGPVPAGSAIPGSIIYFNNDGEVKSVSDFSHPQIPKCSPPVEVDQIPRTSRSIELGRNIYMTYTPGESKDAAAATVSSPASPQTPLIARSPLPEPASPAPAVNTPSPSKVRAFSDINNEKLVGELNLLASLIRPNKSAADESISFQLDFLTTKNDPLATVEVPAESETPKKNEGPSVVVFSQDQLRQGKTVKEMARSLLGDLDEDEANGGADDADDLLSLMDKALGSK